MQRFVLMGMVVLVAGGKGRTSQGEDDGGEEGLRFHGSPFGLVGVNSN